MEDTGRLKLILVGLVLAAIAGGYLFFSGRFARNTTQNVTKVVEPVKQANVTSTPSGNIVIVTPTPATLGAATTKGGQSLPTTGISSLPSTGMPVGLIGIFGVSAAIAGYFLRKFPE